ncbi:hypothetical protein HYH02_010125 [Chlamydomonas schloesseri]|uniref:N-acetyltransferase domain-containing protein n=1 Tax=Chlamydomonas schloesseri TaxID=2026947 RepID=A0A835TC14_9CHLO|nr:hypothetical protein HYH02_010125 [Chlamydomonas schloesseri]|eukprot:KAG2441286.1 hypothetical protein HYH02_010125 [Chlamydomonas schloesseri]
MAMAKETENLELPEATARAGVLAVLDGRASHAAYFLLEEREQVVAQLMITLEWSDWRAADIWWIQSVYVKPECRRRGHFRALYAHVRGECRRAGACGLRLYADNGNERAHAAYEGLGMTSHYKVFEDMFTEY